MRPKAVRVAWALLEAVVRIRSCVAETREITGAAAHRVCFDASS